MLRFSAKKGRRSHLVTFYLDYELSLRLVCRQDVRENREKKMAVRHPGGEKLLHATCPKPQRFCAVNRAVFLALRTTDLAKEGLLVVFFVL